MSALQSVVQKFAFCWFLPIVAAQQPAVSEPEIPEDVRAALFAMPIEESPKEGVRLRIVAADSNEPLAGVSVFFVEGKNADDRGERIRALVAADLERMYLLMALWAGNRYVVGPDGGVVVPDGGAMNYAVAVSRDGVALIPLRLPGGAPDDEIVIPMCATITHTVRVQSKSGAPVAGASVQFGVHGERGFDRFDRFLLARTDDRGCVTFRFPGQLARSAFRKQGRLAAQAAIIGGEPVRVLLPKTSSDEPAVITLPAHGRVIVRLHDADERPRSDLESVTLSTQGVAPHAIRRRGGQASRSSRSNPMSAEEAVFDCVALGKKLVARIRAKGIAGDVVHEQAGPKRDGELVVFAVRTKASSPVLAARLVDSLGMPVERREVAIVFVTQGVMQQRVLAMTETDGSLQVAVPGQVRGATFELHVIVRGANAAGDSVYGGTAVRTLPAGAEGLQQLGELRLCNEPVVVAGRLHDESGEPVAGVTVWMAASWTDEWVKESQLKRQPPALRESQQHRATTDADGRFRFRECSPRDVERPLTIADGNLLCDELVHVGAGVRERTLVVRKPASLVMTFRSRPPRTLFFRFRRDGEDHRLRVRRDEDSGARHVDRLPPGTYDIVGLLRGSEALRIEGVEVRAGETCTDPRLQDIDWATGWQPVRLRVRSPEGYPVRPAVSGLGDDDQTTWSSTSAGHGEVLALRPDETRLVIAHERYRTLLADKLSPELELTFLPRLQVQLTLPEGLKIPEGAGVWVRGLEFPARCGQTARLIWGDAETLVPIDGPGRHRVTIRTPGMKGKDLWSGEIEVVEGPAPIKAQLPITAAELAEVEKQLAKARGH